jgi:hypothetical protein
MDATDFDSLPERIASLNDEQILRMLGEDAGQYKQETLAIAEQEAHRRGLDLKKNVKPSKKKTGVLSSALKSAVSAAISAMKPGRYTAAGKPVICSHCGSEVFDEKSVLLNTRTKTFFDMDWLDSGAAVLICTECSRIHWFAKCPDRR